MIADDLFSRSPALRDSASDDLESFLYQDPNIRNSSGTATYTAWTHGNSPGTLSAVSPTSKKFNLVLANYKGVNQYSLPYAAWLRWIRTSNAALSRKISLS